MIRSRQRSNSGGSQPGNRKKETADLSTPLRSGRDDNSMGGGDFVSPGEIGRIASQRNCHLDRSVAEWRDLRFRFVDSPDSSQRMTPVLPLWLRLDRLAAGLHQLLRVPQRCLCQFGATQHARHLFRALFIAQQAN
jgi:hypothetical protein